MINNKKKQSLMYRDLTVSYQYFSLKTPFNHTAVFKHNTISNFEFI